MGSLRLISRTSLGGKPRLSCINLVSEPNPINPFSNPKSRLTTHSHTHRQKTIQPPNMPLFKYLPHEICKPEPKPTPAIRVYPAAPHEFFIQKPTVKPTTPPKPVTLIRAWLWGLPPDRKKKKNLDSQLHSTRLETETEESWKPTIKAADLINRMTPSHNPPPTRRYLHSHRAASRTPRSDSPAPISTIECRWQSSPTSPAISSPTTPKMLALLRHFTSFFLFPFVSL